ncbi:hypothetical protein MUP79_01400 [Candidatus Bathyarchaeota archaeon]|nr:hypothetical protein [Candidatus Bathyarchaeota archaeon]
MPRRERAKAKEQKHQSSRRLTSEENKAPTIEDVADRTLQTLRNLGNQRFAVSPFSEHMDRWLVNLKDTLSEFETSPGITVDDQFAKERAQTLSNVEHDLEQRRRKEASGGEAIKSLSDNRILLEQIEEDYTAATKEIEQRRDAELKHLTGNVDDIKEELDRIARMKTGIFRAISKKAKAQREAEATQRLNTAQSELASAVQHFTVEQERLRDEHEKRKQTVLEQFRDQEKEVESQETDGSLEPRRAGCEALTNAVNSFLQRKGLSHD